jgi:alkylation response protein AidB-like acyl-CoA dehydrogenase
MTYQAPIRDLAFSFQAAADAGGLRLAFPDLDGEMVQAVLEHAGDLASGVLAPLNRIGDQQGSRLENGRVRTPDGFADAYRQFAQGGWQSLSADPAYGGQGLPKTLELAMFEMVNAANMAFALCPTLTAAAIEALQTHGTDRQKALYLPRLISGEWTGTMQLTEPQAGSDLSMVRAMAEPDGDGGYRLTGQKIFITWGDHDVADNIIGMVLARTPGAPDGVKGLSLFLVPKRMVGEDGALGEHNTARPVSVEHKMGIHASPTCVMAFEGAKAELVGTLNEGLPAMFVMMNAARVAIGGQGVGIAERAYQQALAYARERRQGRAPWSDSKPAAIIDHPDVRRMLALAKAKIEAARAIYLCAGVAGDLSRKAPDEATRRSAKLREELLTPIAKAWSTDLAIEVSSIGIQVHGGMGYIEETGAAQHYRDARIAAIYEGTNGVQAGDLVGRKLGMDGGGAARALFTEIGETAQAMAGTAELAPAGARLKTALAALERATTGIAGRGGDGLAGAATYLKLAGDTLGGALLGRLALAATEQPGGGEDAWLRGKIDLARFYADQVLTGADGLAEAALADAAVLKGLRAEALGG